MKNVIKLILPIFVLGLVFSCSNSPKGEAAKTGAASGTAAKASAAAATYKVDAAVSSVTWTGAKVVSGQHSGTLKISDGSISVKNGNIEAGSFTIDMNSLTNIDLEAGQGKEKLEGHLKSADFFDVAAHPTAKFIITKVEAVSGNPSVTHNITGDLELKGTPKSVTFGANVNVGSMLTAVTPAFKINRTDWGINFGSGIIGAAKDKAISDDLALVVNLAAKN